MGPVRRSQRGKRPSFQVGDVVEIVRDGHGKNCGDLGKSRRSGISGGALTGQLLYKIETRNGGEPLWLVAFDDPNVVDAEISEKNLGPLLQRSDGEQDGSIENLTRSRRDSKTSRLRRVCGRPAAEDNDEDIFAGISGSEDGTALVGSKRKRTVGAGSSSASGKKKRGRATSGRIAGAAAFENEDLAVVTTSNKESDDPAENDDASNGDDAEHDAGIHTRSSSRLEVTGGAGHVRSGKGEKRASKSNNKKNRKRKGNKRSSENEDPTETVEKVKLLTGTLYIYRGANPRVVFARRV